jgi:hypothetical protein
MAGEHKFVPFLKDAAMTENPYVAPTAFSEQSVDGSPEPPGERPIGVSILAVLHLIGGALVFAFEIFAFANRGTLVNGLEEIGIPPIVLFVALTFVAVLILASGVGMWLGTKWGWWLASFYYAHTVLRNAFAVLTALATSESIEGTKRTLEYYLIRYGMRLVVSALLLAYLFKGNVLSFFGLRRISKLKALGVLFGLGIAINVLLSGIAFVANR